MGTDQFLVSVIIPVYNGTAFLTEAVESIQQQEHRPLEIIIVDDGSTDGTKEIATSFEENVRYTYQRHSGPVVARNRGLGMAYGDVIGFLDADDLWLRNSLSLRLERLVCDPSVEIVIGHTQLIRQREVSDGQPRFEKYRRPWPALSLGSAIIRKPVFDKVGLFDHTQPFCDDVDWLLRAQELGVSMAILPEVTLYYRRHKNNITNQTSLDQQYFVRAIKKSLDRRRQQRDQVATPLQQWFEANK
jgi:glycosyltransferase involved in cell wall biosynthesis